MMGNALRMSEKDILISLFRLGWSNRRISRETGFHRKTIRRYRKDFQSVPEVPADPVLSPALDTHLFPAIIS